MGPIQVVVTDANNLVLEVTPTPSNTIILDRGIAGPVGLVWMGNWSSATAYVVNDAVYYAAANASYICIEANTNQLPTNTSFWQLLVSGAGNVTGAASSTDNAVVRFDGTTGKLIQNSTMLLDDAGLLRQFGTTIVSNVNVLSAVYDNVSFSVAGQETTPQGLFFSPDGYKMLVVGSAGDDVNEYNLTTPWVVSSAVYSTVFSVSSQDTSPNGIFFRADGLKMYVVGSTNDAVFQYALTTPWSVATASYENKSFSVAAEETSPTGLFFSPDGISMYVTGTVNDTIYQYTLTTAWDITTAGLTRSFSVAGQESSPNDVLFTGDGTRMFVIGLSGDDVNVYNLSTPWNISTSVFVNSFSVAAQDTNPSGLYIKPDGTKMYMVGTTNDTVYQYTVPSVEVQLTGTTSINGGATVQQDLTTYGNTTGSFLNNSFKENISGQYYNLVSQADIGTAPNEIPLNQYLGNLAYMSSNAVVINPVASATPAGIGDMVFELTNNTTLVVKVKGSDGTVRSATLTLA